MKDYSVLLTCEEANMVIIHDAFDKGYQQGYEDEKKVSCDCKDNMENEYNRGLNDAWEAARKIILDGCLPLQELMQIFNTAYSERILKENTASEVIAKIKEYEEQQKQDTIQVGDEVYSEEDDLRFVVTRIYEGRYEGVCTDGAAYCPLPNDIKKTGRHTETILKVLGEFDEKD